MEKQSNSFGVKVKAAFKRPRFVVEFVAWVLATVLLLTAIIYYATRKEASITVYKVGDKCPEFILKTYKSDNDADGFSTFGINKVTVINYWYTTCDPCKDELPDFEKVYEEYDGAINMFAVHNWSGAPNGQVEKAEHVERSGVQNFLDTAVDKNGRAWNSYKLVWAQDTKEINSYVMFFGERAVFPSTVIVNAKGYISYIRYSSCSESALREAIEQAMNA